jgi:hypothetical protein
VANKIRNKYRPNELCEHLIDWGLSKEAEGIHAVLKDAQDSDSPMYHLRLSSFARRMGHHDKAVQAMDMAKNKLEQIRQNGDLMRAKVMEKVRGKYEHKYNLFLPSYRQFEETRQKVQNRPEDPDIWKQLADCAAKVDYRLEEMWALRVLREVFALNGEVTHKLARAYLKSEQPEKAKALPVKKP